jgi:hypothetical protein
MSHDRTFDRVIACLTKPDLFLPPDSPEDRAFLQAVRDDLHANIEEVRMLLMACEMSLATLDEALAWQQEDDGA